jgi:hypothetical protein
MGRVAIEIETIAERRSRGTRLSRELARRHARSTDPRDPCQLIDDDVSHGGLLGETTIIASDPRCRRGLAVFSAG